MDRVAEFLKVAEVIINNQSINLGKVSKKTEFIWDFVPNYG